MSKVKSKIREFSEDDEKEPVGLEDGGHTILKCSGCGRGLIDIFRTQPNAIDPATRKVFEWKVKAKCCFCGDHSYITEIKGKFHLSGYGVIKEDDPSQDIPETFPGETYEEGEVLIIETVKA